MAATVISAMLNNPASPGGIAKTASSYQYFHDRHRNPCRDFERPAFDHCGRCETRPRFLRQTARMLGSECGMHGGPSHRLKFLAVGPPKHISTS